MDVDTDIYYLDAVASLVLKCVSNSQAGWLIHSLTNIQAFLLAVACMLHSYCLIQFLLQ